jgi:hypothetical protein
MTPEPAWAPLLPTPAHPAYPAYPSGRTAYTSATARVLPECFEDQVSVRLTKPAVNVPRTSHSLAPRSQEAEEAWV